MNNEFKSYSKIDPKDIQLQGDKVLIKKEKFKEKTGTGILLIENKDFQKENPRSIKGTILSMGDSSVFQDIYKIKIGDEVFFDSVMAYKIEQTEESYYIISAYDLLAIIEE